MSKRNLVQLVKVDIMGKIAESDQTPRAQASFPHTITPKYDKLACADYRQYCQNIFEFVKLQR
jgi:hypothetical protein